ncbi:MAG: hypothetical protein M3410_09915 [Acidobacteriota bacterium]|nr:hypothetical protein [Acidobacteriota bacterium]
MAKSAPSSASIRFPDLNKSSAWIIAKNNARGNEDKDEGAAYEHTTREYDKMSVADEEKAAAVLAQLNSLRCTLFFPIDML